MITITLIIVHLIIPCKVEREWEQIKEQFTQQLIEQRQKEIFIRLRPNRVKRACHECNT